MRKERRTSLGRLWRVGDGEAKKMRERGEIRRRRRRRRRRRKEGS